MPNHSRRPFTAQEIAHIKANFMTMCNHELGRALGRTHTVIAHYLWRTGLKRPANFRYRLLDQKRQTAQPPSAGSGATSKQEVAESAPTRGRQPFAWLSEAGSHRRNPNGRSSDSLSAVRARATVKVYSFPARP